MKNKEVYDWYMNNISRYYHDICLEYRQMFPNLDVNVGDQAIIAQLKRMAEKLRGCRRINKFIKWKVN